MNLQKYIMHIIIITFIISLEKTSVVTSYMSYMRYKQYEKL